MENRMIIGILGLIICYFIFKLITRKQKNLVSAHSDMSKLQSNSEHAQKSTISDVLMDDKYKVKGQWDR